MRSERNVIGKGIFQECDKLGGGYEKSNKKGVIMRDQWSNERGSETWIPSTNRNDTNLRNSLPNF